MTQPKSSENAITIHTVCDYVLLCLEEAGESCNVLKLQKLLYYVQSWNLAFEGKAAFDGEFEAWVHGPVNRSIYARFAATKSMYSPVTSEDVRKDEISAVERIDSVDSELGFNIKSILEGYGSYTGTQLEELTHSEAPWIEARSGFRANQSCNVVISEKRMQEYYAARLSAA